MKKTLFFVVIQLLLCGCQDEPLVRIVPISGVTLDQEDMRVFLNQELTLTVTVSPADASNKKLIWESSDESVITVSDGVIKAVGLGTATVTVKTEDGEFSSVCEIKVTEECQTQTKGPITLDLGAVTATTVCFNASLDVNLMSEYDEVGFVYSTESNLDVESEMITKIKVTREDYSEKFMGLSYNTEYYYTIYVLKNGVYQYGEIQKFKTDVITVDVNNIKVTKTTATVIGKVIGGEVEALVKMGLQYSVSSSFESANSLDIVPEGDGTYSVVCECLVPGKEYYYRTYVCQNDTYVYSEILSFATKELVPIVPPGCENLSVAATANCYIISQSGSYCFLLSKGNRPYDELLLTTNSASVLWESFETSETPNVGDLIKSVSYSDAYIVFTTAEIFKEGNAVIAAKDADNNILWSWHIWLTDQPQEHVYNNNAGTMMDRNLGACACGDHGLFYQWGRKDPFIYTSVYSNKHYYEAQSTIMWPSTTTSSSIGTVSYVTANPTTFVYGSSATNYDWHYSSRDNTLWTTSDKTKSIYDPCPAGWRVPDSDVWRKAGFISYIRGGISGGVYFNISSPSETYYPATEIPTLSSLSSTYSCYGHYWSASGGVCLHFDHNGHVTWQNSRRNNRSSVRCQKE